jgi:hypothetical protein
MGCPNGSRRKAGTDDYEWINQQELMCTLYGEDSWICQAVKSLAIVQLPVDLIETSGFCSSYVGYPSDIAVTDLLTPSGFINKVLQAAKATKWKQICECTPKPKKPHEGANCYRINSPGINGYPDCSDAEGEYFIEFNATEIRTVETIWDTSKGLYRGSAQNGCPIIEIYDGSTFLLQVSQKSLSTLTLCDGSDWEEDPPPIEDEDPPPKPPPGIKPPPGRTGDKGEKGDKGEAGQKGDKGTKGDTGTKGDKGDKGDKGVKGDKGDKGDKGNAGNKGDKGDKGDKGNTGDEGLQGKKGDSGLKGDKGEKGDSGSKGDKGEKGNTGETGKVGAKGDKGDKGDKGADGIVEFTNLRITYNDCGDSGNLIQRSTTVQVPKGKDGDTAALYTLILGRLGVTTDALCTIENKVDHLDLNVGIPMRHYEGDTATCCVLYFNDQRTTKSGVGRYINVPAPNRTKVLEWAATDPTWETGNWYKYTQYRSSQGLKIANYAKTQEICDQQQLTLLSLTDLPTGSVYYSALSRLVANKGIYKLKLKRITFFASATEKAGRQDGQEWYKNPKRDIVG